MGFFEEFQKTTDSQYVLITDYIAQLAKEQNSGIESTINYLLRSNLKNAYQKQPHGSYVLPYYDLDIGSPLFNTLMELKEFFKKQVSIFATHSIEGELELFNKISIGNLYLKKSELPVIRPTINKVSEAPPPPNHIKANSPFKQKTVGSVIEAEKNQATNDMVNDVYGRTYDVNQHKKNREDDYLTLVDTLNFLNYNTDVNYPSYDYVKLRDLARRKLIKPCFYFDGYVGSFRGNSGDELYTEIITGYFTYRLLSEEICNDDAYMRLPNNGVMIFRVLEKQTTEYVDYDDVFLFHDKPQRGDEAEDFKLTHIESEEIRFSKRELDNYIASLTNTSQDDTPAQNDGELLAKLEQLKAENSDLNARLSMARDTYRQNQSEIKELKAQLEKVNADNAALNEQLSSQIEAPNSVDELKGIAKLNIERSIFISTAKAIADYVWSMDKSEAIRTGVMVQQIKMIMSKADYTLMPDDDDTIRNWLSDIAPPHAKKSGRTPKDAPREITLIMKN